MLYSADKSIRPRKGMGRSPSALMKKSSQEAGKAASQLDYDSRIIDEATSRKLSLYSIDADDILINRADKAAFLLLNGLGFTVSFSVGAGGS